MWLKPILPTLSINLTDFTQLNGGVKLMSCGQQQHRIVNTRVQRGLRFKTFSKPEVGERGVFVTMAILLLSLTKRLHFLANYHFDFGVKCDSNVFVRFTLVSSPLHALISAICVGEMGIQEHILIDSAYQAINIRCHLLI